MKQTRLTLSLRLFCLFALLAIFPFDTNAQQSVVINLAPIDGVAITPDNIFSYQVQSPKSIAVLVKGTIRYRSSGMSMSYSFNCQLSPGINALNQASVQPQWQFSSPGLRDLFFTYKTLPQGTYEYCVKITPANVLPENAVGVFDECLYHRADDLFLINLVDPENDAKLKEYNPALSWIANYSFSNQLTYRVRVAEIKQGQNAVNAVMRNQPVYDERNLMQNTIVYPVYAKPLEANTPYAWTVDAYYKGILLGGAETWKFIIPDDTLAAKLPANRSYIDIKREKGTTQFIIAGELKIKYLLDKYRSDELSLLLVNDRNEQVALKPKKLSAVYGDNRYTLNLVDSATLKHQAVYRLIVNTKMGENYTLPFKYLNPEFAR